MALRASIALSVVASLFMAGCGASINAVADAGDVVHRTALSDMGSDTDVLAPDALSDVLLDQHTDATAAVGDAGVDAARAVEDAAVDAPREASPPTCFGDGGDPTARFSEVYRRTIDDGSGAGCTTSSRCHGRPGEYFDLSNEAAAFASLVGAMGSCGVRVTPCSLEQSYASRLMHSPDTCRGMRHTGFAQVMTPAQLALFDAWILGGAQR